MHLLTAFHYQIRPIFKQAEMLVFQETTELENLDASLADLHYMKLYQKLSDRKTINFIHRFTKRKLKSTMRNL